jgi:hypothetical protein
MSISSQGTSVDCAVVMVLASGIELSFGQAYAARLIWANSNATALVALIRLSQNRFIRKGVDIRSVSLPKIEDGLNGCALPCDALQDKG